MPKRKRENYSQEDLNELNKNKKIAEETSKLETEAQRSAYKKILQDNRIAYEKQQALDQMRIQELQILSKASGEKWSEIGQKAVEALKSSQMGYETYHSASAALTTGMLEFAFALALTAHMYIGCYPGTLSGELAKQWKGMNSELPSNPEAYVAPDIHFDIRMNDNHKLEILDVKFVSRVQDQYGNNTLKMVNKAVTPEFLEAFQVDLVAMLMKEGYDMNVGEPGKFYHRDTKAELTQIDEPLKHRLHQHFQHARDVAQKEFLANMAKEKASYASTQQKAREEWSKDDAKKQAEEAAAAKSAPQPRYG